MPLVVFVGAPSSGKSSRAQELKLYLQEVEKKEVIIVNEESERISRNRGYQDSVSEKDTRATLKSAVERNLTRQNVVIFDSVNYIKGFRYELYCIARALSTTYCMVYCSTPLDVCIKWNENREGDKWDLNLLKEISDRMEVPNSNNRWDKPLFEVDCSQVPDLPGSDKFTESDVDDLTDPSLAFGPSSGLKMRIDFDEDVDACTQLSLNELSLNDDSIESLEDETPSNEVEKLRERIHSRLHHHAPNSDCDMVDQDQASSSSSPMKKMKGTKGSSLGLSSGLEIASESDAAFGLSDLSVSGFGSSRAEESSSFVSWQTSILPLQNIADALLRSQAAKPNIATQPQATKSTNFVQLIDKITKDIIAILTDALSTVVPGDTIPLSSFNLKVVVGRETSAAELRRLRRQFQQITQMNPPPESQIAHAFVTYVNSSLSSN